MGLYLGAELKPVPILLSGVVLVGAVLLPMTRYWARGRTGAILVLGLVVGGAGSVTMERAIAPEGPAPGLVLDVEGQPCGRPRWGGGVLLCQTRVVGPNQGGLWSGRLWVSSSPGSDGLDRLNTVDPLIRVRMRVRTTPFPSVRNPGQTDWERIWKRQGIFARVYLVDPLLVVEVGTADEQAWAGLRSVWSNWLSFRQRVAEDLVSVGAQGAVLAALALGHRGGLSPEQSDRFRQWGLSHLLAVSGLHVVLVGGLFFGAATHIGIRVSPLATRFDLRRLGAVFSALGALGYGLATGLGVPVFRALVAWWFYLAAFLSGRAAASIHALALAVFLVVLAEPALAFDLGAQLSFAATGALLLGSRSIPAAEGRRSPRQNFISRSCGSTASVLAWTAPLLAWNGLMSSGWGVLANLVAVPLVAWVLLPSALVAACWAAFSGAGDRADWVLGVLSEPARLFLWALEGITEQWPSQGPVVSLSSMGFAFAMAVGTTTIVQRRVWVRVGAVIAFLSWLGSAVPSPVEPIRPRLVALDVGQGDAILIQGEQADVLVDGGRSWPGYFDQGRTTVLPALRALGVARLDVVVATHADLDHRGGLEAVLQAIPTDQLWLPDGSQGDPGFKTLLRLAERKGVEPRWLSADESHRLIGDLKWKVLWPQKGAEMSSRNDGSLVLRVEVQDASVLLTGDIGEEVEKELLRSQKGLRAGLLKVAHHGSQWSSSASFLRAVSPDVSILSAGCRMSSGLPSAEALHRLREASGKLLWTGRDGAILVPLGRGRSVTQSRPYAHRARRCEALVEPRRP